MYNFNRFTVTLAQRKNSVSNKKSIRLIHLFIVSKVNRDIKLKSISGVRTGLVLLNFKYNYTAGWITILNLVRGDSTFGFVRLTV